MNRTVSFHSPPYLFLRSFFRVFNPSHWEPHPLVFHPRAPTIALKHQCRYPLSYETSPHEESLQWVALPSAFHFVHNPSWKNLLPVSYTHLRAHETRHDLVCRLLLEKKKTQQTTSI